VLRYRADCDKCKKKTVVYLQLIRRNDTLKTAKIMNGDITLAALCHCQRASVCCLMGNSAGTPPYVQQYITIRLV